jgi:GGDEF domain-containing protein
MFFRTRSKNVDKAASAQDEDPETALVDRISGLYRDWYFERRLREEVVRCARYDHTFAVVVWEMRLLPDEALPDDLLARAREVIQRRLRDTDLAARAEGAQFMALLVETPPDLARMVAFRLKSDLEVQVHSGKGRWKAGYATFPQDGVEASVLSQVAMRRLKEDMGIAA